MSAAPVDRVIRGAGPLADVVQQAREQHQIEVGHGAPMLAREHHGLDHVAVNGEAMHRRALRAVANALPLGEPAHHLAREIHRLPHAHKIARRSQQVSQVTPGLGAPRLGQIWALGERLEQARRERKAGGRGDRGRAQRQFGVLDAS